MKPISHNFLVFLAVAVTGFAPSLFAVDQFVPLPETPKALENRDWVYLYSPEQPRIPSILTYKELPDPTTFKAPLLFEEAKTVLGTAKI